MILWSAVSVSYGSSRALGPVTLDVADGEWVGVIGPNGSGKSTMLKAAVSVVDFQGEVSVSGSRPRPGVDIAWMPQGPVLPEGMTVSDYVALGRTPHLGYLEAEKREDIAAVERALGLMSLEPFVSRPLSTLSGGEAQRVVIARALAQEAPVMLLDEPTANLDIGHAVEVLDAIDDLRTTQSLTVVSAVHDLTLAGRYADRLALLSGGLVRALGDPDAVLTEETLAPHYGPGLRVIPDEGGPVVIPTRQLR